MAAATKPAMSMQDKAKIIQAGRAKASLAAKAGGKSAPAKALVPVQPGAAAGDDIAVIALSLPQVKQIGRAHV